MSVNQGSGFVVVATATLWAKGGTVVDDCFAAVEGVSVTNPTTNAWAGAIDVSEDGVYNTLDCSGCTALGLGVIFDVIFKFEGLTTLGLRELKMESLPERKP